MISLLDFFGSEKKTNDFVFWAWRFENKVAKLRTKVLSKTMVAAMGGGSIAYWLGGLIKETGILCRCESSSRLNLV